MVTRSARPSSWPAGFAGRRGIVMPLVAVRGPTPFYPARGHTPAAGIAICQTCSVVAECDEAGKAEDYGTWGGRTMAQRREGRSAAA